MRAFFCLSLQKHSLGNALISCWKLFFNTCTLQKQRASGVWIASSHRARTARYLGGAKPPNSRQFCDLVKSGGFDGGKAARERVCSLPRVTHADVFIHICIRSYAYAHRHMKKLVSTCADALTHAHMYTHTHHVYTSTHTRVHTQSQSQSNTLTAAMHRPPRIPDQITTRNLRTQDSQHRDVGLTANTRSQSHRSEALAREKVAVRDREQVVSLLARQRRRMLGVRILDTTML